MEPRPVCCLKSAAKSVPEFFFFDETQVFGITLSENWPETLKEALKTGAVLKSGSGWISAQSEALSIRRIPAQGLQVMQPKTMLNFLDSALAKPDHLESLKSWSEREQPPAGRMLFSLSGLRNGKRSLQTAAGIPVYVNGRRIQQALVNEGDWIFAAGRSFRLLENWLLIPWKQSGSPLSLLESKAIRYPSQARPQMLLSMPPDPPETITVEACPNQEEENHAAGSPAGMILCGSLASSLSGLLVAGQSFEHAFAGIAGALLSAGAFAGWYGWSGHKRRSADRKRKQERFEAWQMYLQATLQTLEEKRQQAIRQFLKEQETLLQLDGSFPLGMDADSWRVPIGIGEAPLFQLSLPQISFEQQNTAAGQILEQIRQLPDSSPAWLWLARGESVRLCGWSEAQVFWLSLLLAEICLRFGCRLAWVAVEPPVLLPSSRQEEKPLVFADEKAFLAYQSAQETADWIVISTLPFENRNPQWTWIEWQKTENSFPVSDSLQIVEEDCPYPDTMPATGVIRRTSLQTGSQAQAAALSLSGLEKRRTRSGESANLCVELAPSLFWDLKSEGPHALIAGATGSGKSEALCTLLFLLAYTNSARQVQFVLIDFKGGSFLIPLAELPHTAAVLSNLAQSQISRLETAIHQELDFRQKVLADYLTKHPGEPKELDEILDPRSRERFSHLLIVVDEFGQLKARCPEFLKSLQESARIGRSLGIHLLLCTQKPAGLVDEQIWANSKSRLCFGVLDAADSREVLGHDGACRLRKSGEFILQSGEAEKKGRSFYLKAPAGGLSAIREKKAEGFVQVEQESLQEHMRNAILARNEKRLWLMEPDFKDRAKNESGIWIDRIDHFEPFEPEAGTFVLCVGSRQASRQVFEQLAAQSKCHVISSRNYAADRSRKSEPLPGEQWEMPSLWQLEKTAEPLLVLLEADERLPAKLLEMLLDQAEITLVLAMEAIGFRQESLLAKADWKISTDLASKDQLALISEGSLRKEEGWPVCMAIGKKETMRLICGQKRPPKNPVERAAGLPQPFRLYETPASLLQNSGLPLLGAYACTLQPCWLTQLPLCIAFADPNQKPAARSLLDRICLQNPLLSLEEIGLASSLKPKDESHALPDLRLLDLSEHPDPPAALQKQLEAGNLLYFGPGFAAWQYLLQVSAPEGCEFDALSIDRQSRKAAGLLPAGMEVSDDFVS